MKKQNLSESLKIANKVKYYLVLKCGIDDARIITQGNGSIDAKALGKSKFKIELFELN